MSYDRKKLAAYIAVPMGDDLERAERTFSRYSPSEMLEMHGHSGQTRQSILDEYRKDRELRVAAQALLDEMLRKEGLK